MNRVIAFVLFGILAIGGIFAITPAFQAAGEDITNVNETFQNPTGGDVIQLEDSDRTGAYYDDEVSVFDETGAEMEAGTDYEWFQTNGTLKVLSGGDLAGDDNGTITYGYDQTTETQRQQATVLGYLLGMVEPLLVGATIVMALFVLGRFF